MNLKQILKETKRHYNKKIIKYGPCYKGVDWGTDEGQKIRFEIICKKVNIKKITSIIDYGCGYGKLLEFIIKKGFRGLYQGYDISQEMIKQAQNIYKKNLKNSFFTWKYLDLKPAEYCIASGVFNIKLMINEEDWLKYITYNLKKIDKICSKGFIFNMFEDNLKENKIYSDVFYTDSKNIRNYCINKFSKDVEVVKNYYRNDFTIIVTKNNNMCLKL
jgi:SAM-dependent methyltransferase